MWYGICTPRDGSHSASERVCNYTWIKLFLGCYINHFQRDEMGLPETQQWILHAQGEDLDMSKEALALYRWESMKQNWNQEQAFALVNNLLRYFKEVHKVLIRSCRPSSSEPILLCLVMMEICSLHDREEVPPVRRARHSYKRYLNCPIHYIFLFTTNILFIFISERYSFYAVSTFKVSMAVGFFSTFSPAKYFYYDWKLSEVKFVINNNNHYFNELIV